MSLLATKQPSIDSSRKIRTGIRPSGRWRRGLAISTLRVVLGVVVIGSWQVCSDFGWVDPAFTGQPNKIWAALSHDLATSSSYGAIGSTLYEIFAGFVIGAALGVVIGLLLHELPLLNSVVQPYFTGLNSMPRIALAPLFVLWFGLGAVSKIVLAVSLVFFIVVANTMAGLQSAEADHLRLARMLGANRWRRFRYFVFPAAVPAIFAGLQLGLIYSFLGVVAGEMLGGTEGLGAQMAANLATFHVNEFFAELLILVAMAMIAAQVMKAIERHLVAWRHVEMGLAREGR